MRRGQLREYFTGAATKRLSAVDAARFRSNQHEIGTTKTMRRQFLGEPVREKFETTYAWLDEGQEAFRAEGFATHYDVRAQQEDRSPEWHLYYSSNRVTDKMQEGDSLFLALTRGRRLFFIVTPEGSTSEGQLFYLFDLTAGERSFVSREVVANEPALGFSASFILSEIGLEFRPPDVDALDDIVKSFGETFPSTAEFSQLARRTLPEVVSAKDDPDTALVAWCTHEERLFLRCEHRIIASRIEEGFRDKDGATDVKGFMKFATSVRNRRMARAGLSLEHHLDAVLRAHEIAYVRGAQSENKKTPDFLFPNEEAYRVAPDTGAAGLTMLGVKTTCKDRWRQVLDEASKIRRKHLLTLEPAISVRQTTQMEGAELQLVVPREIQGSYTDEQRAWLWNVGDFIRHVRARASV